jgi:hypothetical protein
MWHEYQYGNDMFRLANLDGASNIHVGWLELII